MDTRGFSVVGLTPGLQNLCDQLPVPVTFADPHQHDLPLIYANPAFTQLTGWHPSELLGRNCRILQGKDSDRTVTDEMSLCCSEQRSDIFTLINYRRTGESFVNIVALRPVRIHGTRHLIMGCQMEFRPSAIGTDLARHSEAIGSVVHLVSRGMAFRKQHLGTQEILRLDALAMRFEAAFITVQNALIRTSADHLLLRMENLVKTTTGKRGPETATALSRKTYGRTEEADHALPENLPPSAVRNPVAQEAVANT